ncbi:MAG: hypothetical protein HC828_02580 [Blastochloris sp.]|nr:hypothetical protein [Blastochloris sp.]
MKSLRVYVSAACTICDRTYQLLADVRAQRPHYPLEVIDLDQPDVVQPAYVFGTPTFVLGEQIISLGNPALADLLARLDAAAAPVAAPPTLTA